MAYHVPKTIDGMPFSSGSSMDTGGEITIVGGLVINDANNNVRIGTDAGYSLTTGYNNILFGNEASRYLTVGYDNFVAGTRAGYMMNGNAPYENCLVGMEAGYHIYDGIRNCAYGYRCGWSMDKSSYNVLLGNECGFNMKGADSWKNVMIGYGNGKFPTTVSESVYMGQECGLYTNGYYNVILGFRSGGGEQTISALTGTAIGGTVNTIMLPAGFSSANDFYNGYYITLTGGHGSTQTRRIIDYVGSTHTAYVDEWSWINKVRTIPDTSTQFSIFNASVFALRDVFVGYKAAANIQAPETIGAAQGGSTTTIIFPVTFNSTNNHYVDWFVTITGGTGAVQTRLITQYNGSTFTATINKSWDGGISPDTSTKFSIYNGSLDAVCIGTECGYNMANSKNVTYMGSYCGHNAKGNRNVAIGYKCCYDVGNTGSMTNVVAIGTECNRNITDVTLTDVVAIGTDCAYQLSGNTSQCVMIGTNCGYYSKGSALVFIGQDCGSNTTQGSDCVLIGNSCGEDASKIQDSVYIGQNCGFATQGTSNVFVGVNSGGGDNTTDPLFTNQTVYMGYKAGSDITNISVSRTALGGSAISISVSPVVVTSGTAPSGWTNGIQLAAGASTIDDYYVNMCIVLTGGTGAGQWRYVDSYYSDLQYVYVNSNWTTPPNGTTTYQIVLDLAGAFVNITNAPGQGQTRKINTYVPTTNTATVDAWDNSFVPGITTTYNLYEGPFDAVCIGTYCGSNMNNANSATYIGSMCGQYSTGNRNVYLGTECGKNSSSANNSVAIGFRSLENGGGAGGNSAIGSRCLSSLIAGARNVAIGNQCLENNYTGNSNVAIGYQAANVLNGDNNVILGYQAMIYGGYSGGVINNSICIGYRAGYWNNGTNTVAIGTSAIGNTLASMTGDNNVAIGTQAGENITSGELNCIVGNFAGQNLNTGSKNVIIGTECGLHTNTNNLVAIGYKCASYNFGSECILIGTNCGVQPFTGWSDGRDVMLGNNCGYCSHGRSIFIGDHAGARDSEYSNIAIGVTAGTNDLYYNSLNPADPISGGPFYGSRYNINIGTNSNTLTSQFVISGIIVDSEVSYAVLSTGVSEVEGAYNGYTLKVMTSANTSPTKDQIRTITYYNGASRTAYLSANWTNTPQNGTAFEIYNFTYAPIPEFAAGSSTQNAVVGINTSARGSYNVVFGNYANCNSSLSVALGYGCSVSTDATIRLGEYGYVAVVEGPVGYTNYSDRRLKKNIVDSDLGLNFITKLTPRQYSFETVKIKVNQETESVDSTGVHTKPEIIEKEIVSVRPHYGFIAQEVKEVMDTLNIDFAGYKDPKMTIGGNDNSYLGLNYDQFIAPAVKAIQELNSQLVTAKQTIQSQQETINSILAELITIKSKLAI